jgi:hypothetical protein
MFVKIQFFFLHRMLLPIFSTEAAKSEYHAYDMPCCVHFTGYNQQLKFLVH